MNPGEHIWNERLSLFQDKHLRMSLKVLANIFQDNSARKSDLIWGGSVKGKKEKR